jgi:hypothetical protein
MSANVSADMTTRKRGVGWELIGDLRLLGLRTGYWAWCLGSGDRAGPLPTSGHKMSDETLPRHVIRCLPP